MKINSSLPLNLVLLSQVISNLLGPVTGAAGCDRRAFLRV